MNEEEANEVFELLRQMGEIDEGLERMTKGDSFRPSRSSFVKGNSHAFRR